MLPATYADRFCSTMNCHRVFLYYPPSRCSSPAFMEQNFLWYLPHFLLFATYVYLLHRKKVPKTNKIGWPIFPPFCPGGLVFLSHRLLLEFLLRGTENKPLSILPQPFCGLTILSCSSGTKDGLIHPILFPPCLMGDRRHQQAIQHPI